eukprot:TRINITY_DN9823_c0_g7_i1.p1 TRINITY_DN9823_c0_g7~~TRINITY_DN9823_c0_g7_i1.p1  ORF type:complete len:441 (-),score=70.22 TRINITY_DN9823_c0_g7_i1:305-1627(-)
MSSNDSLNARQRKHVHMASNIFASGGPDDKSLYTPGKQTELYEQLKSSLSYVKTTPDFNMPSPAEIKRSQNAGSNAVIERKNNCEAKQVEPAEKKDKKFMPKEFWSTSVDLRWHDVRNERCRDHNSMKERLDMDAKALKRQELSSELFNKARMKDASTDAARHEIVAETNDYLTVDSSLHAQRCGRKQPDAAPARVQHNLASSLENTMPRASPKSQAAAPTEPLSAQNEPLFEQRRTTEAPRSSGGEMRNYSDLFGNEMGIRQNGNLNRQDVLGTRNCSFLDTRSEIATRKQNHWRDHEPPSKQEELQSNLFERASPRGLHNAEQKEAMDKERGCWESKDVMEITSEVSRRRRQKEFSKDFSNHDNSYHCNRKRGDLSSNQVRRNINAAQEPQVVHETLRFLSPRIGQPAAQGVGHAQREVLLKNAKDTKLASLQSSIFY